MMIYWTAWVLMAAGYSFSGWMKLHSPSWIDGTALYHVLNNPLARPGFMRDFLLALPAPFLHALTWASLGAELLFVPLSLTQRNRIIAWSSLVAMNLGIVCAINFADLTIGMLLLHLFTFDPNWLAPTRSRLRQWWVGEIGLTLRAEFLRALETLAFYPASLDPPYLTFPSADRDQDDSTDETDSADDRRKANPMTFGVLDFDRP
jgi:hypothetical protein